MLFIWVDKESIYDVLQVAEQWKFKCVPSASCAPPTARRVDAESRACVCVGVGECANGTVRRCVENICWIRMQANHRVVEEPGSLINKTKLTLLMFRKVRGRRGERCPGRIGAPKMTVIVGGTRGSRLVTRTARSSCATSATPIVSLTLSSHASRVRAQ